MVSAQPLVGRLCYNHHMNKLAACALIPVALILAACGGEKTDAAKERSAETTCRVAAQKEAPSVGVADFGGVKVLPFGDGWKVSGTAKGAPFLCDVEWDAGADEARVISVSVG